MEKPMTTAVSSLLTVPKPEIAAVSRLISLPTSIFTVIRDYVEETNYRQFMNGNKRNLQDVKYETIIYKMKINMSLEEELIERKIQRLNSLKSKVKNISKQIRLHINQALLTQIEKYAYLFANIFDLKIQVLSVHDDPKEFNFNLFNNIERVNLSGFENVLEISSGFQNVRELKLEGFLELTSMSCPLGCVNDISVDYCPMLKKLSPLTKADRLCFVEMSLKLPRILQGSHCSSLYYSPNPPIVSRLDYLMKVDLSRLQELTIHRLAADMKVEHLRLLSNINSLCLYSSDYPDSDKIQLPLQIFHGKDLRLGGFNLSSHWHEEIVFENLLKLTLKQIHVERLPTMPKVKYVTIKGCTLEDLPSFEECIELTLEDCLDMYLIDLQPKVQKLTLITMNNDLTTFYDQFIDTVFIEACSSFEDASIFHNVRHLDLIDCSDLRSFEGLKETFLSIFHKTTNRLLRVLCFDAEISDFSTLSGFHYVELDSIDNFTDGNGVHDIVDLEISNCEQLESLSNVSNIQHSIYLRNCHELRTYEGLGAIPIVILHNVNDVQDLSGLMNCQKLYLLEMKELTSHAKLFASKEITPDWSSQRAAVFETIQECYEICPVSEEDVTDEKLIDCLPNLPMNRIW